MIRATWIALSFFAGGAIAEDLNCLSDKDRPASALYQNLQREAYESLDRRLATLETLKTPAQIAAHQKSLRAFFTEQIGDFPEKRVPLESQTVRTILADGYRIECVIFKSREHHSITANLYLPDSPGERVPGVVVSSGHSRTAKTADYNQRFGIMMARHGIAALCFDPIGQGERSQILNEQGEPTLGTTTEHFLMGYGATLVGRSTAHYRIWDAIRSIDYLASRPEVDAQRIGMTGCSGGGTLTSYVMALDDRVVCAAPACYLTTFRRLIETIGPQDAEQNIYGQVLFGMDHPDYVIMRAPKPTLISSTTDDFFNISGSWENFRQAKRVYGQLGFPERVDLVEVEGKHGVQPQNLATIAHWMQRWLLARDEPVEAIELPTRPPNELLCTESGQVLTSLPDERSVFDLNVEQAAAMAQRRATLGVGVDDGSLRERIRGCLSLPQLADSQLADSQLADSQRADSNVPAHEDCGRVRREGYHIDKLVLRTGSGVPLPALTFHPPSPVDDAYLYIHDDGKLGDSEVGGEIEKIVAQNYAVVSIDLCGQGETGTGKRDKVLTDWKSYYLAYLLGKPIVGMRVRDVLAASDFVAHYEKGDDPPRKVHLVGVGQSGIVALHAAALRPERFASVTIRGVPRDWATQIGRQLPAGMLDGAVHGALEHYDLPDLVRLAGKEKVKFSDESPRSE